MVAHLKRKLNSARVLAARGSTDGERRAAKLAVERLERRLKQHRPTLLADPWLDPPGHPPSRGEIHALLDQWQAQEIDADTLLRWAADVVDAILLPDLPPSDRGSIPIEVVLQLSTLHLHVLTPEDIPALRRFLDCQDPIHGWRCWFEHLEAGYMGPGLQQVLAGRRLGS